MRLIFAFDLTREAIFLVADDKAGQWNARYRTAIPSLTNATSSTSPTSKEHQEQEKS